MRFENKDEYREILVSDLGFSQRTYNCLKRARIDTLYSLIENQEQLSKIRNMGTKSITEVKCVLCSLNEKDFTSYLSRNNTIQNKNQHIELSQSILDRPATDLRTSVRVKNAFRNNGIETIQQVVNMSALDMFNMRNMGELSVKELQEQVELLYRLGEDYFSNNAIQRNNISSVSSCITESSQEQLQVKKGFDYATIDILVKNFNFKVSRMSDWFDVSRQRVSQILEKRTYRQYETWTGKRMTDSEQRILVSMMEHGICNYSDELLQCYCMNDRQGDFVCLFIYKNEIKCFFLKDLAENLQEMIQTHNYHRYSEGELSGESEGGIVYCIQKPYFLPKYPERFRANAQLRGMTSNEYALFISGFPIGDNRAVDDRRITAFLEDNLVDGKVYISSDPSNQWIRSLASRNGYSIKEFIELYGYDSMLDGSELTTDGARNRHKVELEKYIIDGNRVYFPTDSPIYKTLSVYCYNKGINLNEYIQSLGYVRTTERPEVKQDLLEKDMQVRIIDGTFEEKIFARYPLLGSKIIKEETVKKLDEYSRMHIDGLLRTPNAKLSLRSEMQIALALINHAKNWNNEENREFWNYIVLQFGYRDTSGTVIHILQNSLENAMKKNGRLFLENANGREFKATAVIHALTTRKSWMALFDFLFDFYKKNLNWEIIPDDPLVSVMVRSLQKKLGDDNQEENELNISSSVYSFQEGIRKLILYRPVYSAKLFGRLLRKIDSLINSEEIPVKRYEEQLCEEWFAEKITRIANTKRNERRERKVQRDVAIDYSKIRAKVILKNENDVQLVLPDIRLKNEDSERAFLALYYGKTLVHHQPLSWYGNELGKTLNGIDISLPGFPEDTDEINMNVKISCENEVIYDSEDTLCRKGLFFYGNSEISLSQIKNGCYTMVLPSCAILKTEKAEAVEIEDFQVSGLRAYFLELKEGYVVTVNGNLVAFDSVGGTDIRVLAPLESMKLPFVRSKETDMYFAYHGSTCTVIFGNRDFLQQYILLKDGERIEFSDLTTHENGNGLAFSCPIESKGRTCRIQVISLSGERLLFDRTFILIYKANENFNREFYYSIDDYKSAVYNISIDDFSEEVFFSQDEEDIRIPYMGGELCIPIPKVTIAENTGNWINGKDSIWYIDDIPQNSLLMVANPPQTEVRFLVGEKDIMYDGKGLVTIGNVMRSYGSAGNSSLIRISMSVSGPHQSAQYSIARVCFKEQFLKQPEFWTENNKLFWDHGGTFIGKKDRTFTLRLLGEMQIPYEFQMDENTACIDLPENMAIGNYHYEVSILSGSLFRKTQEIIAEGDCVIGDQNLLRFMNRRIVIESITDEYNEEVGHIPIRTAYIDHIEFQGMEDTSEGYCPIYSGVLYTTGYHGERYEFSYDVHTNKKGVTKMMVNPVRIVYVGNNSLCISDSDGDGLYYYYYYDRDLECRIYALTDHEYTKVNKNKYSNADLYLYSTERI